MAAVQKAAEATDQPAAATPEAAREVLPEVGFVVDLDGFEGPLDLLLDLARAQKVDLARISILALVDQFIAYLEAARTRELTLAAEYLVMAAWLAFMKSQLLLPKEERLEDDVEAMAEALAARLRKLDAIRHAVAWLDARPLLGSDRLVRGAPEAAPVRHDDHWRADLAGLLEAYARVMARGRRQSIRLVPRRAMSVEAALDRLSRLLSGRDWQDLLSFLPPGLDDAFLGRSAMAASLVASLELAKRGTIDLEQEAPFGPIRLRRR